MSNEIYVIVSAEAVAAHFKTIADGAELSDAQLELIRGGCPTNVPHTLSLNTALELNLPFECQPGSSTALIAEIQNRAAQQGRN